MQHRPSGFPDPDESLAHGSGGGGPSGMTGGDVGGRLGYTQAFDADDNRASAARSSSGARLLAQRGSVDVIEVSLDRQVLVIGRRLTNDIVIHDTNVSRQHARLLRGPDGYSIEDTQSSNGTFVNDERVFGPRPLRTGDVIRIGDAVFVYEAAGPSGGQAGVAAGPADWTQAFPDAATAAPTELTEEPVIGGIEPAGSQVGGSAHVDHGSVTVDVAAEDFAADELENALARPDASPVASADAGQVLPGREAVPPGGASATGTALADVGRDLAALADTATRLADRVRALESVMGAAPRRAPDPGRPSSDDTVALVEFSRLLRDLQAFGDPEAATAAANLLDQLSRQPRDVELLLSISRQAPIMAVVLRQHAYLMRLAPLLDEALGRMLQ